MEYCIVTIDTRGHYTAASELEKRVSTRCKEGWKPQGGVSISSREVGYSTYYTMSQAMVKYDKPYEPEEGNGAFLKAQI